MSFQDVIDMIGSEVGHLDGQATAAILPLLDEAQKELTRDLAKFLTHHGKDGAEKFTAQKLRQALVSVKSAMAEIKAMEPKLYQALMGNSATAGNLAVSHLVTEIQNFSLMYAGEARPVPLRVAALLATGKKELVPQFKTSAARYSAAVMGDIRAQLAIGVVRGETMDQLVNRLVRLGGPKGPVALRGVAGEPGAVVANISEGLFTRYRHWAERLARTEVMNAYNAHHQAGMAQLAEDDPEFEKRWDASLDSRICKVCQGLHGETVRIEGPNGNPGRFPGGFEHPPAHPQCRCVVVAWHKDWAGPSEAVTMQPDGSAEASFEFPAEKPPAPPAPIKPPKTPDPELWNKFLGWVDDTNWKDLSEAEIEKKAKSYVAGISKTMKDAHLGGMKASFALSQEALAKSAGFASVEEKIKAIKEGAKFLPWYMKNVLEGDKLLQAAQLKKFQDAAKAAAKQMKADQKAAKEREKAAAALAKEGAKKALEAQANLPARVAGRLGPADFQTHTMTGDRGMGIMADRDHVEGGALQAVLVKNEHNGATKAELNFKLVSAKEEEARRLFKDAPADKWKFLPRTEGKDRIMVEGTKGAQTVGESRKKTFITASGMPYSVELGYEGAMRNAIRITVLPPTPENISAALEHFGQQLRVDMLAAPKQADIEYQARARIISKLDPGGAAKGSPSAAAESHPLVAKVEADARPKEVFPGHVALYSDALAAEVRPNVIALTHDSSADMGVLEKVLTGSGPMASATRFSAGIFTEGMSTGTDFGTGGADGFFTRIVNPGGEKSLERPTGGFRLIIDPKVMGRLDWWAFNHDNYGRSGPGDARERWTVEGIKKDRANGSNEVMFQKGVHKDDIMYVVVGDNSDRTKILGRLKAQGITHYNGKPIEDFVKVGKGSY